MPASARSSRKTTAKDTKSKISKYEQKLEEEHDLKRPMITTSRSSNVALRASIILVLVLIIYFVYPDKVQPRKAGKTGAEPPELDHAFVETKVPGKGIGLIATRDIEQGKLIIKEKPLFVVPSAINLPPKILIRQQLDGLSQDDRTRFFNLSYVQKGWHASANLQLDEDEIALAIFETNAIAAGENTGIFLTTARMNHACSSAFNAVYSWRHDEGALVVYALKPIRRGEEILTTYTDTKRSRDERLRYLLSAYSFECQCPVCSLPEPLSSASDRRLTLMTSLRNALSTWATGDIDGKTATGIVNEIWRLGDEEGYRSERGQLAADAAHVAAAHSDSRSLRAWTTLALKWYTVELGSDSIQAQDMEKILSNLRVHPAWASRQPQAVSGPEGSDTQSRKRK